MRLVNIYYRFASDLSKAGKLVVICELEEKMKLSGKFQGFNILSNWAERMKKGFKKRLINQTGQPLYIIGLGCRSSFSLRKEKKKIKKMDAGLPTSGMFFLSLLY